MLTLTPAAARQIHAALDQHPEDEQLALRVAAHVGADGELEFGMGFDEQRDGDLAFNDKGVDLLIGRPSQPLLNSTVLDYVEVEPGEFRFIFAPGGCGSAETRPNSAGGACGSGGCNRCGGAQ